MEIYELKGMVPQELIDSAIERNIKELTPPQVLAIRSGLLKNRSIVISAPTASGKTFIAELAMMKSVLWDRTKCIYVAPMRALVNEKYNEIKNAYPFLKIAISMGDLDSVDMWLEKYDVIFVSTEKFDSLMRHGMPWLNYVGCIIFDEVHMIDDPNRGPTLEVLITRLKRTCKNTQIVALSATVGNASELSEWLNAEFVESNYRPVPLHKGITFDGKILYEDHEENLKGSNKIPEIRVVEDTLNMGKQLIIFYATKRNAEAGAERLSEITEKYIDDTNKQSLEKTSDEILHALDKPTSQCEKLSRLSKKGIAFHHGGLVNSQRSIIEEAFRNNNIKAICSTTTLGLGVNLPAHTVLVRDITRYNQMSGSEYMGINEVLQLFGRAGRPRYDKEGRALLIAKDEESAQNLMRRYIRSSPEPILSKLGVEPVLRMHALSFIAGNFLKRRESILDFLTETFYGFNYNSTSELKRIVDDVLDELEDWKFITESDGAYEATRIGRRVSELYLNPVSAKWIIDTLPKVDDDLGLLFMVANTSEMRPYCKVTEEAEELFVHYYDLLESSMEESYYEPEKPFSTALMLRDWINEINEQSLQKKYNETPGALYSKLTNADWMLYSSMELAKLVKIKGINLLELRVRVKYGIKRELLDLVRLEQIGRVRARMLFGQGIKTVEDLRKPTSRKTVEKLFGKDITDKILGQLSIV